MKVLLVDDSKTNLGLLGELVRSVGAEAVFCNKSEETIAISEQARPDLVIVDYRMPVMDGVELTAALKNQDCSANIPIVMITASTDNSIRREAFEVGVTDFLCRPIDPVEVKARLKNLLSLREAHKKLEHRADQLQIEVDAATRKIREREEEIIFRLARAAEFRDTETGAHIIRMAKYCDVIARNFGLDETQCQLIYRAAPLHDVGKIGISDTILLKSGKLTDEERKVIKEHTTFGSRILANSQSSLIQMACEIARSHHEKWDGSGYPNGLKGEEIPLSGRIATVADVFDALTSARTYKPSWSAAKSRAFIVDRSYSHFDPRCVAAFVKGWDDILEIHDAHKINHEEKLVSAA